jgi:hypothetical protein
LNVKFFAFPITMIISSSMTCPGWWKAVNLVVNVLSSGLSFGFHSLHCGFIFESKSPCSERMDNNSHFIRFEGEWNEVTYRICWALYQAISVHLINNNNNYYASKNSNYYYYFRSER